MAAGPRVRLGGNVPAISGGAGGDVVAVQPRPGLPVQVCTTSYSTCPFSKEWTTWLFQSKVGSDFQQLATAIFQKKNISPALPELLEMTTDHLRAYIFGLYLECFLERI
jgi:hypothetical protein